MEPFILGFGILLGIILGPAVQEMQPEKKIVIEYHAIPDAGKPLPPPEKKPADSTDAKNPPPAK